MSRLWDTPEFWARCEAEEALREMPDVEPGALAGSLEKSAPSYDGEPEMVALIVAELRRRAVAGIRFWPGPHLPVESDPGVVAGLASTVPTASASEPSIAELLDDEIPW